MYNKLNAELLYKGGVGVEQQGHGALTIRPEGPARRDQGMGGKLLQPAWR